MAGIGRVISTALQFIDKFTKPSADAIKNLQKMGREFQRTGRQIQNAGKGISNVGSSVTKSVTLPVAGIATAAVKASNDFKNSMAKVSTIADTTVMPMKKLEKQVKNLSNATGVSVNEIAEAQYQAISAGVDTASSVKFVSTAVKAAKGGFTDAATAVDGLSTVLNSYGLKAKEATKISDQMLMTQNFGKTSFGELASSMGKVIPIASSLNVSTNELFSSIAVLTKNGIATSEAVTGMKAAYSNVLKPSSEAAKAAKKMGMDFSAAHLQSVGWAKFLDEIKVKTGGSTQKMAQLFGSTEALNSVTVLAGKGSADFAEALGLMAEAGGSTEKAYKKMLTPAERMNISVNKIKNSALQFGAALTPVFNKVANVIGKTGDKLNGLSASQVKSIVKWAGIAAAIGPTVMLFGKVVTAIGTVTRTFGKVTSTIGNFGGILKTITSPAGIVISVLAGIALAAVFIIKNWDKVQGFLKGVGKWFENTFKKAGISVQDFKNKFSSIGTSIGNITDKIGGAFKKVGGIFTKEFAPDIKAGTKQADGALGKFAAGTARAFDGVITAADKGLKAFDALLSFFSGAFAGNWHNSAMKFKHSLYNIFPPDIASGLSKAFDTALPAIKAVVDGIKGAFGGLVQDIKTVFGDIKNVFKGFGTMFKGILSGDAETALKGFKTAAGGILDTVRDIFKAKINAIKNFTVNALKNFLPEGTVNAIAAVFDNVAARWDNAVNIAKACIDGFAKAVKPLLGNIRTVFKGLGQFVSGVFAGDWKKALNGLKNIAKGAFGGLINIIKAPFKIIDSVIKGAVKSFKGLNIVKGIFTSLGNAVKKVMSKCGVDIGGFNKKIKGIKTHASSILNNIKGVFKIVFGAIGKAVRTASVIIAAVFGKKISRTCSTSKAALTAFKVVAVAIFKHIKNTVGTAMAFIVPAVAGAFGAITGLISSAVNTIAGVINGIIRIFDGIIKFVTGVFTGNWKQAWQGVVDIFGGIFDTLSALIKAPVNAVIGIINGAISGINKLGIKIPDWVPKIGGKKFGIDIPTIPMLYKGTSNWRGGTAVIHDRGGEIVDLPKGTRVYPHDKSIEMARREGKGNITINIQKLADRLEVRSDEDIDRIAEALVYKLKRVAFNTGMA